MGSVKMKDLNLFTAQTICVTNIVDSPSKYDMLMATFKHFGRVKSMKVEKDRAYIHFRDFGIVKNVMTAQPLTLGEKVLEIQPIQKIVSLTNRWVENRKDYVVKYIMQMMETADQFQHNTTEKFKENEVICTLKRALDDTGDCIIYTFGSRVTGLATLESDLDVFFDKGNMYKGMLNQSSEWHRKMVQTARQRLKRGGECKEVKSIPKARVPIVTFFHKSTGIHCDVSFKNGLSCQNTQLIKFFISLDERVKPLLLFFKDWARKYDLHGPPLFSSYSIMMLVIFYLQQVTPKILPSVKDLQKMYDRPKVLVSGWDCSFTRNKCLIPKSVNTTTLIDLIMGFFDYYANFDYGTYFISLRDGKLYKKSDLSEFRNSLPENLWNNLELLTENPTDMLPLQYPFYVMDPFDLSHNLTKGFTRFDVDVFVHFCVESFIEIEG